MSATQNFNLTEDLSKTIKAANDPEDIRAAAREALNRYIGVLQTFIGAPGTVEMLAQQGMKLDGNAMFTALFDTFEQYDSRPAGSF